MAALEALELIAAVRGEMEAAADAILTAAERALEALAAARDGETAALEAVEHRLCDILQACAFQDLTGQRLSRLELAVAGVESLAAPADSLLNGPALPGRGLDQAAADRLMGAAPAGPRFK